MSFSEHHRFCTTSSVVILFDQSPSNKSLDWKQIINMQQRNFEIYDHLYPFRKASKTILRQDIRHRGIGRNRAVDITGEEYADQLAKFSNSIFGTTFSYEQFIQWFNGTRHKDAIVICGFGHDESSQYAIRELTRRGASVVYKPVSEKDVKDFLEHFDAALYRPFH